MTSNMATVRYNKFYLYIMYEKDDWCVYKQVYGVKEFICIVHTF